MNINQEQCARYDIEDGYDLRHSLAVALLAEVDRLRKENEALRRGQGQYEGGQS